ncbi:MAG: preprotein translocase subunit SecE [Trueperaceae bacterium]|nr:preprotein translocase subunit SecE [Trueperaceae bacterium]
MVKRLTQYLRNSRAELSRVTWPTRDEVVQATQATLVFVVITALFLLVVDGVFGNLIGLLT